MIGHAYPNDAIMGEEDVADLQANPSLRTRVAALARDALSIPPGPSEATTWGLGLESRQSDAEVELLEAVGRGSAPVGQKHRKSSIALLLSVCKYIVVFFSS